MAILFDTTSLTYRFSFGFLVLPAAA